MKKITLLASLILIVILAGCTSEKRGLFSKPTDTPTPTFTPTVTPSPTNTPTPTNSPTPTYTPTPTNTPTPTFTPTPTPIFGYDYFNHNYFAIIKERLQTYTTEELGDSLTASTFASYDTPVNIKDFKDYDITEDKVIFHIAANTLTDNHPAFDYEVDLAEAKLFMNYDDEGNLIKDTRIRKDLDPNAKMIALTYDDGPYYKIESRLIETFKKYNARATFFAVASRIKIEKGDEGWESCAKSAKALYDAGNQVEDHTFSHRYFTLSGFTTEYFWKEINQSVLQIAKATGHAPHYIRMPGGYWRDYMVNCTMPIFYWNGSDGDTVTENRKVLEGEAVYDKNGKVDHYTDAYYERLANNFANTVCKIAKDGSVILIHSIHEEAARETEIFMEKLSNEGYIFVTLDELAYYKGYNYEDGVLYFNK